MPRQIAATVSNQTYGLRRTMSWASFVETVCSFFSCATSPSNSLAEGRPYVSGRSRMKRYMMKASTIQATPGRKNAACQPNATMIIAVPR